MLGAIAIVGVPVAMRLVPIELAADVTCAYRSPILCLELADDAQHLAQVIRGPSAETWRFHLLIDMVFLSLYGALIGGSILGARQRWAPLAAACVVAGAGLDIVENVALLMAVDGDTSVTVAVWARYASQIKFLLLAGGSAAGMAGLSRSVSGSVSRTAYLGIAALCAVGLAGPLSPLALELGAVGLGLTMIALIIRSLWPAAR